MAEGKRIRPLTLLLAARTLKPDLDLARIYPLAAACEMTHTFTLIHDDLPSLDNDDLRRGIPTTHLIYGEPNAILAGDSLLNAAFGVLIDGNRRLRIPAKVTLLLLDLLSKTVADIVLGQILEMKLEKGKTYLHQIYKVYQLKTASFFAFTFEAAALFFGKPRSFQLELHRIGRLLGMGFQIRDDIIDLPIGGDLLPPTVPHLIGEKQAATAAKRFARRGKRLIRELFKDSRLLEELADLMVERTE